MTNQRISINTLSLGGASFEDHITQVLRLGVTSISPTLEEITDYGSSRAGTLLRDAGLTVATLTHRAFGFSTPTIAAEASLRLEDTIAVAEAIGAETITFTTGGRDGLSWDEAAERFVAELAPSVARARGAGTVLSLEPTSHLYSDVSIAHRLADTVWLAERAGIGVGIDIFACWFDSDLAVAIEAAAGHIALVQVSDYVNGDRTLPCRAVPGDGVVPLDQIVALIEITGYQGYYDLEVIGPRLLNVGAEIGLARGVRHLTSVVESSRAPTPTTPGQSHGQRTQYR